MEIEQLKALAVMEAENIKNYATDDEKSNLDLSVMDSFDVEKCVYGIMTGSCNSDRAQDMILKCMVGTFMFAAHSTPSTQKQYTPEQISDLVYNRGVYMGYTDVWYTPLETYISQGKEEMKEIVEIIRG